MNALQGLADRVADGATIGDDEARIILASHDLITIGTMADDVRRRLHGLDTTFVRVFEMHVDAVPRALPDGISAGEFRLIGAPASVDAASAAVEQARRLAGPVPLTGLAFPDLVRLERSFKRVFARLRQAGLDGIADTPVDVPFEIAAVRAARAAGLGVERLTVHQPPDDPVSLFARVCALQTEAGGFRAFAPLPRVLSASAPTTGYDDVKLVALARIAIREIPSIQVDWPLYGPKLAQVALTVGADDVDGIAAVNDGNLGTRRSPVEEIKANIRAAGQQPVERDGRFDILGR